MWLTRLSSILRRSLAPPYLAWILLGFSASYVAFFIVPVYLSSDVMQFHDYIPAIKPIGVDLKQVITSTKFWFLQGRSPYLTRNLYPPLAFVLFIPLTLVNLSWRYVIITWLSVLAHVWSTLGLPVWLNKARRISPVLMLIFVTGMFSYGLQFELERGQFNVIAASLAFLAIWIYHQSPRHRPLAYVLFTVAVQLKLYPMLLALMLVHDWRDWMNNIRRLALLGTANALLLLAMGPRILADFIEAVAHESASRDWIWMGDHSIHSFVGMAAGRAAQRGWTWFGPSSTWLEAGLIAAVLGCIFLIVLRAYRQGRGGLNPELLLACTLGTSLLPAISNDYRLSILVGPVAVLLTGTTGGPRAADRGLEGRLWTALTIAALSAAYSATLVPIAFKPENLVLANACPALLLMLAAATALAFQHQRNLAESTTDAA